MPIYEYQCEKCGHLFELIQKFSDRPKTKCPKCRGTLRKLISASAIRFKGSGWYVTDYAGKSGSADPGEPSRKPAQDGKGAAGADSKGSEKGSAEGTAKGSVESKTPRKEKPGGRKGS